MQFKCDFPKDLIAPPSDPRFYDDNEKALSLFPPVAKTD
jgi:hypothetical protein